MHPSFSSLWQRAESYCPAFHPYGNFRQTVKSELMCFFPAILLNRLPKQTRIGIEHCRIPWTSICITSKTMTSASRYSKENECCYSLKTSHLFWNTPITSVQMLREQEIPKCCKYSLCFSHSLLYYNMQLHIMQSKLRIFYTEKALYFIVLRTFLSKCLTQLAAKFQHQRFSY